MSTAEDGYAGFPSVGGDWATFAYHSPGSGIAGLALLHMPSRTRIDEFRGRERDVSVQLSVTDGVRVVAAIHRMTTRVFDTMGPDLDWRLLPGIPT